VEVEAHMTDDGSDDAYGQQQARGSHVSSLGTSMIYVDVAGFHDACVHLNVWFLLNGGRHVNLTLIL
jgi:hypothetical protein